MTDGLFAVLGFAGALLVLLAYLQVSRHAWKPRARAFQLSNALGAVLLMVYSLHLAAWPNVLLNAVWLGVAVGVLVRLRK